MAPKTVLITGCSDGGIGSSLAAEFQLRGCTVFATARSVAKMQSLADKGIQTLALDVNDPASIAASVEAVSKATNGRLDILINNAGVTHIMPFADSQISDLRHVFETNVIAVLAVTQAFLPLLIEAKGVVATLGSITEVMCPPFQVAYNASKAAVHAMCSTLRVELAPLGVRVVTLITGSVGTKLFDNSPTKVPADSLYAPIAGFIEERGFLAPNKHIQMKGEKYAQKVASDLLKSNPSSTLWRGGMATVAWLISCLGWEGMLDSNMAKHNSLDKIK